MDPIFLYATCQAGAEPVLKQEVARDYPMLRFAFSRPGFVTFKWAGAEGGLSTAFDFHAVFARSWGISLGKINGERPELAKLATEKAIASVQGGPRIRLHAWERDRYAPEAEPKGFQRGEWERAARAALLGSAGHPFHNESKAYSGETVFDIVVVEENEWWLGLHKQTEGRMPFPGSRAEIKLPDAAPSRAYLKIEEGLLWSGAQVRSGDRAIEVGSAPGGASFALLARGLKVMGIDPAAMDKRILAHANFVHAPVNVNQLTRDDLPQDVQWLLLDMNVAPSVSLFAVDRLATLLKSSLLGAFLTVKLNDWKIAAEIPGMFEHLKSMGFQEVRATQLPSNRQEIFIYCDTGKRKAETSG